MSCTTTDRTCRLLAAKASAGLSLLFIIVYGGCNWLAAHRSDIGIWYYPFEKHIPFVPLLIVPYMSIDLFFVAAPFLCQRRTELQTLTVRITIAILAAGACFLLIPLRVAVPFPKTTGWAGSIFDFLHGFDQPYNLFPSLHITLWAILFDVYLRHTKGLLRLLCFVWFSLIAASALLTYQHHIADVVGALILALLCFYLVREDREPAVLTPNYRIGFYYFVGGLLCFLLAMAAWPWTALLLWPAASLCIVAAGYWWLGPKIYRKEGGRLAMCSRVLLAPTLLGHTLSLLYYRRQSEPWNAITPGVWIGARLSERESVELRQRGVTAVLDLTSELSEARELLATTYLSMPVLDLSGMSPNQLAAAVDFISENAKKGVVYVHCKAGYSRTAMAAGAYLLSSGQTDSVQQAIKLLKSARPTMVFRPEVIGALEAFYTGSKPPATASPATPVNV